MSSCVFCNIVTGEMPSYEVYEDDDYVVILDAHPATRGHMLAMPKKHYRWTYDVPNFGEYWEVARKVGQRAMHALGAEWLSFLTHGGVEHAHIHVLPRYEKDVAHADPAPKQGRASKEELNEAQKVIVSAMNRIYES
jgi:histidine triad (HIT) family protein